MASIQAGIFIFVACASLAAASSFLSRAQEANIKDLTPQLEASILQEIEEVLDRQGISQDRLERIEDVLRTTFLALPKNELGRLGHEAVRYSLHSYFVQKHAWYVNGLEGLGVETVAATPTDILQDKVEEFVQGAFERRLGSRGLDVKDLAFLAATYENLVHKETLQRLNETLGVMGLTRRVSLSAQQVEEVMDIYMIGYILNLNYTVVHTSQLKLIKTSVVEIYPTWPETQKFLRQVQARVIGNLHMSFFSQSDVVNLIEAVFDQYGLWQDKECQQLKHLLLDVEDKSIGVNGSGRVRLSDFYNSALRDNNWQFSESIDYLTTNGALDTHGGNRVIIPNYVNSPSNCLASSKFYSVCCINECEDLMDHVEHQFAAPAVLPDEIIEFVSNLPSASVAAGRTLQPVLVNRLREIAQRYDGLVPLHSRLFAQWMHHAYPRECAYPHVSGTTKPQTVDDYMMGGKRSPVATKSEMAQIVESWRSSKNKEESEEITRWSHHDEFYVGDHRGQKPQAQYQKHGLWRLLRPIAFAAAILSALVALVQRTCGAGMKKFHFDKDLYV